MFPDSSVTAGALTRLWPNRLCNWIPGAHSIPPLPQHPGIYLVLFLPCHKRTTISLLWLPHISWRRLRNSPWHAAAHSGCWPRQDIRPRKSCSIPLPPHPWLVAPPSSSCQGLSFLPLYTGQEGLPPPWLPFSIRKPKSLLQQGAAHFVCLQVAQWEDQKGNGRCLLCAELARERVLGHCLWLGESHRKRHL